MSQITPFINGIQHSFASIRMSLLGRVVTGVVKISYDDSVNLENQYGAGNMVDHRGVGNYEAKCSLELFQYEVVGIQQAAGGLRMQQIPPFDIIVTFLPEGSAQSVTDVIKDCQFKTNARDLSQGDTMSKVPLELIVSNIKWHGQL